jgi:hypothetical protein
MRIVSKNRFSRVLIKKVRYNNFGTILKQDISIAQSEPCRKITKPTKVTALSYDYPVIAGTAL